MAYATCSPHLAETQMVVEEVMQQNPEVSLISADKVPTLERTGATLPNGAFQLWTDLHGTDAMYLALLTKQLT